tara:strand:+ start:3279 stop:3476 length:198 start_codon:yes stop_codon:yes gene_type:complete
MNSLLAARRKSSGCGVKKRSILSGRLTPHRYKNHSLGGTPPEADDRSPHFCDRENLSCAFFFALV